MVDKETIKIKFNYKDSTKTSKEGKPIRLFTYEENTGEWIEYGLPSATDTDGIATFERTFMAVDGAEDTIDFKAVYDGNDEDCASESEVFTVTLKPRRGNSVIDITSTVDSELSVGDKVTVTGVLKDKYTGEGIGDVLVRLYCDSLEEEYYDTVLAYTDSNGEFTFEDYIIASNGYHNLYIEYNGDDSYGSCNSSIPVVVTTPTRITTRSPRQSITAGEDYNFTCTLYSTIYENGTSKYKPLDGHLVQYRLYDSDDQTLSTGTVLSDDNGEVSFTLDGEYMNHTRYLRLDFLGNEVYDSTHTTIQLYDNTYTLTTIGLNIDDDNVTVTFNNTGNTALQVLEDGITISTVDPSSYTSPKATYNFTLPFTETGEHTYQLRIPQNGTYTGYLSLEYTYTVEDTDTHLEVYLEPTDKTEATINTENTFECGAYNENGEPIQGITVKLNGLTDTIKATTDENGIAEFTYTPTELKTYNIYYTTDKTGTYNPSTSDTVTFTTKMITPIINLIASTDTITLEETCIITGSIVDENLDPVNDQTNLHLYIDGDDHISEVTVTDGEFTYTYKPTSTGKHTIVCSMSQNETYNKANDEVEVTVTE